MRLSQFQERQNKTKQNDDLRPTSNAVPRTVPITMPAMSPFEYLSSLPPLGITGIGVASLIMIDDCDTISGSALAKAAGELSASVAAKLPEVIVAVTNALIWASRWLAPLTWSASNSTT
jgi:hypothetical protein